MKNSLIILSFFVAGIILGISRLLPEVVLESDYSSYALYLLMFLVGVSIGADRESWKLIRQMNVKILLLPAAIATGSLGGAALTGLLLPDTGIRDAMAVGAGFGYYSLSSILISELSGETLGTIALLANILREIFTLLATPLLILYFGKTAGIAAGGATSMDTTLPVITRYSGREWAIVAVFSGIVLTILVPFLVSLIFEF